MSYSPGRQSTNSSANQSAVLETAGIAETDEVCSICGKTLSDNHACLYDLPASLLTVQDAALAPMFQATQNAMVKPWVKGLEFNACDIQFFKNVRIVMP